MRALTLLPLLLLAGGADGGAAAVPGGEATGATSGGGGHSKFRVVWNSPWPLQCYTFCHVDPPSLNLSAYSIEANGVNGNGSMSAASGGVLTLWDEDLGLYPSDRAPGKKPPQHGGVPQIAVLNLTAHLAKLTKDITEGLRSPRNGILIERPLAESFDGLGILDWEAWPFTWSRFGLSGYTPGNSVYMNTSVALVLADHPTMPAVEAEVEAGRRWDTAARTFIEATLATLHKLRPKGRFGFFGWPDCDGRQTADGAPLGCDAGFQNMNDQDLGWLWATSSALFPSTYIAQPPGHYPYRSHGVNRTRNVSFASNQRLVDNQIAEAVRLANTAAKGGQRRPLVYPYGRANFYSRTGYENANSSLMKPQDLAATVARPAAHGVAGVVLWGGSDDCEDTVCGGVHCGLCTAADPCMTCDDKCEAQANYIAGSLGPVAKAAVAGADACAAEHCPGGGRCATIDGSGATLPAPKCV